MVLAAMAWTASVARATEPDARQRAHDAFQEGVAAYQDGRYEEALAAFRRANTIVPSEQVRLPIASCLERLDRPLQARVQYASALDSGSLSNEQVKKASEGLTRVEGELARLQVVSRKAGAAVRLDGEPRCTIPCPLLWLEAGSHTVELVHRSQARRETIELERGERAKLALDPAPDAPPAERDDRHPFPSWLSGIGVGVLSLGVAGIVGFGLRTQDLRDEYVETQNEAIADEGLLSRDLANASIGVAVGGALVIAADLIWWITDGEGADRPAPATGFRF
jgi:tetratricopeptide (TPR) repeat protein